MIGQDISGVLWWFSGLEGGGGLGWNYRFYTYIEYTIIFLDDLKVIIMV